MATRKSRKILLDNINSRPIIESDVRSTMGETYWELMKAMHPGFGLALSVITVGGPVRRLRLAAGANFRIWSKSLGSDLVPRRA